MDRSTEWDSAERHGISRLRCDIFASDDGASNLKTKGCKDVRLLSVGILDERDAAGAVWIVLDANDGGRSIVLAALEINETIVAFVATTDVTAGDAAGVIPTPTALQWSEKTLLRLALGDLVEGRKTLVAGRWSDWLEIFQGHGNLNVSLLRLEQRMDHSDEVERFTFLEANDGFLPMVSATGIGAALAAEFAVVVGSADGQNGFSEELFNGLFDLKFVGLAVDFESDLVIRLLKQSCFFGESDVFNDLVNVFHDLGIRSGVQAVRVARV